MLADTESLQQEHQLLLESVQQYPMPHAIYDKNDRLVVWNKAYEALYEKFFHELESRPLKKHLYYSDLVRSNASESLSGEELESYVSQRVLEQRNSDSHVTDCHYPNLGWYRVSKHSTSSGGIAGFAIDINEMKQREADLLREVAYRKQLEVNILKLANTDPLTGIANRRHFIDHASSQFNQAKEDEESLCLLMIDIDHFKSVNDTYGHATGDDVIATVANAASTSLRDESDVIGRIGGEEFAITLPRSCLNSACAIAENIRQTIASLSFVSDGQSFKITISVGLAKQSCEDSNIAGVLKRADDALYVAKSNGRNRVEVDQIDDTPTQRAQNQ